MKETPPWNRRFKGWPKSEELPQTEDEARTFLEAIRWPNGPVCPHCGSTRITRLSGTSAAAGRIQCNECRKQFTVTVGTQWHRSHLTLVQRLRAISVCVLNKDVPITQLQKDLGVRSYRTACRLKKTVLQVLEEWSATPEARKVGPDYVALYRYDEAKKIFADFIEFIVELLGGSLELLQRFRRECLGKDRSDPAKHLMEFLEKELGGPVCINGSDFIQRYCEHLDDVHRAVFVDAAVGTSKARGFMPSYRYNEAKKIYRHIFRFFLPT